MEVIMFFIESLMTTIDMLCRIEGQMSILHMSA